MIISEKLEKAVDNLKDSPPFQADAAKLDPAHRDPTDSDDAKLRRALVIHMLTTYRTLRRGMGWIAIFYPVALLFAGLLLFSVDWQPSISDYYYALPRLQALPSNCQFAPPLPECASKWQAAAKALEMTFPLRAVFCGGLIAIGVFLILYKGISWLEDWALNFAGAFAIGVAIFPMNTPFSSSWPTWCHFACAVLLFVCMAFVCRFCAKDTLRFFPANSPEVPRYIAIYKWLSVAMLGVIALGAIYGFNAAKLDGAFRWSLFCIEAAGVVVFGTYWVIKSNEISKHKLGLEPILSDVQRWHSHYDPPAPATVRP